MKELEIHIENDRTAFKPGEEIRGQIKWNLPKDPEILTLGLFWRTIGKGTEDIGVPVRLNFEKPGLYGHKDFTIKCPEGPYSFSGKLISIVWGLELTGKKGKNAVTKELTIGPDCREVVCTDYIESLSTPPPPVGFFPNLVYKFRHANKR